MNAVSETMLLTADSLSTHYTPNFAYARAAQTHRGRRSFGGRTTVFGLVLLAQVGLLAAVRSIDFSKRMPLPEAIMVVSLTETTLQPSVPTPEAPKFTTPTMIMPQVEITVAPPAPTAITLPPPPPAPVNSASQASVGSNGGAAVIADYQENLLRHLARHKRYPAQARATHREGVALVRFTMDRTGNVMSVALAKSSGANALDEESLALLRRAAPLPAPPAAVIGNPVDLVVPVEFSLH